MNNRHRRVQRLKREQRTAMYLVGLMYSKILGGNTWRN